MKLNFNLSLKRPNLKKLNLRAGLKYLPPITFGIMLVMLILTLNFLYRYFYETIAEVKVVSILKSQVALNQVNVPLYEKVYDAWENKKKFDPAALSNLTNPFLPLPETKPSGSSLEEVNLAP